LGKHWVEIRTNHTPTRARILLQRSPKAEYHLGYGDTGHSPSFGSQTRKPRLGTSASARSRSRYRIRTSGQATATHDRDVCLASVIGLTTLYGLIVKERAFEFFPLQEVVDIAPIPPETKVVPPSGGLNTRTSTVSGCAMSPAVIGATNWSLLTKVVARKELFQLTTESRRKPLPLIVNRNWLPPAVALLGEIEVMDGAGVQVPQDTTIASVILRADMRANLDTLAIGLHPGQLADGIER